MPRRIFYRCVDWNIGSQANKRRNTVASFTDAWIETALTAPQQGIAPVASFTDAWIETEAEAKSILVTMVASFTDAWIETGKKWLANRR